MYINKLFKNNVLKNYIIIYQLYIKFMIKLIYLYLIYLFYLLKKKKKIFLNLKFKNLNNI